MRRGKTTVSKASIKMMNMRTIPAIDAHQFIRDEIQMTREWYQIRENNRFRLALRRSVRNVQRLLHRLQFFEHGAEISCVERICPIALRFLWIVMDFHEYAIYTCRYSRTRQYRDKLGLASAYRGFVAIAWR